MGTGGEVRRTVEAALAELGLAARHDEDPGAPGRRQRPAAALVDLTATARAGIEWIAEATREDPGLLPLALAADRESARRAFDAGAALVLRPPWERWELVAALDRLVSESVLEERLRQQSRRLDLLVHLQEELLTAPPARLYDRLLRAAVETVPGAEGGTVIVREGERYRFRAAVGYRLEGLREVGFSADDMCKWHRGDAEAWRAAEPRIVSGGEVDLAASASALEHPEALRRWGRLAEIRANLYLPVVHRRQLLAVLNLDNFHDVEAFTRESLEAARVFGPSVAALMHEVSNRHLLAEAAATDPLTGLPNRRAFDRAMARELARGRRHGDPFSLLMLDLRGFKEVNDRLGHRGGDRILASLAAELRARVRETDLLARWGGDEFVILLPRTAREDALEAAQRWAEIVRSAPIAGEHLAVDVGAATFSDDGEDAERLLQAADQRMYATKSRRRGAGEAGGAGGAGGAGRETAEGADAPPPSGSEPAAGAPPRDTDC